jgi:hypothetical protein
MSIAHLVNHRVALYREAVTRDRFGGTVVTWVEQAVPGGLNAWPDLSWSGVLQDSGPGEQQANKRRWLLTFRARERDVLSVELGVEAPKLLRVLSEMPAAKPGSMTAHHYEYNVEVWQGELTLPAPPPPPDPEPDEPDDPEPDE